MEQQDFLEALDNLKVFAKSNGDMVSRGDILDCLGHDVELDDAQWQMIAGYLKMNGIKVVDITIVNNVFEQEVMDDERKRAKTELTCDKGAASPRTGQDGASGTLHQTGEDEKKLLQMYLDDLKSSASPLTRATEAMILQDVCDKDAESRDVLVKNYFFKVVDWMKEYEGQGVAYMDLVQEANLVVMDELNRRDWMKELDAFDVMDSVDVNAWIDLSERLDDYLKAAIMVVVDGLVDEQTSERMAGNRVAKVVNRVNDAANEAYAQYGRKVTAEELAQFMQEPLEVVKEALQLSADKIENVVVS